jgi:hypothetical protein
LSTKRRQKRTQSQKRCVCALDGLSFWREHNVQHDISRDANAGLRRTSQARRWFAGQSPRPSRKCRPCLPGGSRWRGVTRFTHWQLSRVPRRRVVRRPGRLQSHGRPDLGLRSRRRSPPGARHPATHGGRERAAALRGAERYRSGQARPTSCTGCSGAACAWRWWCAGRPSSGWSSTP